MGNLMWNWYEWETLDSFNVWHDNLKEQLGYPLIGYNQATGEPQPESAWVTEYTKAYPVEDKWIAVVETEYAKDLIPTNLRRPIPSFLYDSQS